MTRKRTIAVLGATGHVGLSLAHELSRRGDIALALYSRRPEATRNIFKAAAADVDHHALDEMSFAGCDVVVNALGFGAPGTVAAIGLDVVRFTLEWEERIKAALMRSPDSLYVFISSGAVYGALGADSASEASLASYPANTPDPQGAYGLAKFAAETWHRTWRHARVLDVRVFGYISPCIDLNSGFFLAQTLKAMRDQTVLPTTGHDMIRDYVGPGELSDLILAAATTNEVNAVVDIYSKRPAGKFELLDALKPLGLTVNIDPSGTTGPKRVNYFSRFKRAATLGYVPTRDTVEIVTDVARAIMAQTLVQRQGRT